MARQNPELAKMIAKVAERDCDTPEDLAMGLCYAIQEHVRFPLRGEVIGEEVSVVGVEEGDGINVLASCVRKGRKYRVELTEVHLTARPKGVEWIDAYAQFRRAAG